MARTRIETLREVTQNYLAKIQLNNSALSPVDIQGDILDDTKTAFDIENSIKPKGEKWRIPDKLEPIQVAQVMLAMHYIRRIVTSEKSTNEKLDMLTIYCDSGPNKGIYISSEDEIRRVARLYSYTLTYHEFKEVLVALREEAPRVTRCMKQNLIPVNNGIFDYDTKQLLPFSPEYVFLSKSRVDYNSNAQNIVIHNPIDGTDWDVESWMSELNDDAEVVNTLWEVLGAIVRPLVPWGMSAWFYSESGNNGKGTLCELMRQLCGDGSYTSIPLADFSKDFMLEPLVRAQAIIVDENDVGIYIDKAGNWKSVVTGDVVQINRKFENPVSFQFKGFMVQCLNEMPRVRDKSDSFYRRQLFIPFTKCFTGAERKYIKHDYLHRKEVLEYVLYKVLHMDYYELSMPDSCKLALAEYKEFNDPVRQFMNEIMPQLQWDLVPFSFLYDLYKAWYTANFAKGDMKSKQSLIKDVLNLLSEFPDWECPVKHKPWKPANRMSNPEPLIAEYNLTNWMNPMYLSSRDVNKKCLPLLKGTYTGITRIVVGNDS